MKALTFPHPDILMTQNNTELSLPTLNTYQAGVYQISCRKKRHFQYEKPSPYLVFHVAYLYIFNLLEIRENLNSAALSIKNHVIFDQYLAGTVLS